MRTGVFAGSFCPVTVGHVDAMRRASKLVDKLYVAVGVNVNKKYAIPADVRADMLKRAIADVKNAEVVVVDGMMTDFCKSVGATVMVKSVRNATELQYVLDLVDVNADSWDGETVFVAADKSLRYLSSSLVRELAALGKPIDMYVPSGLAEEILKYLV